MATCKWMVGISILTGFTLAGCASPQDRTSPGAEGYYRETVRQLGEVEQELPEITATASAAAKLYVEHNDLGLAADGLPEFFAEISGRSGGIMALGGWWPIGKPQWKGVMLYCLQPDKLEDDLKRIATYNERGSRVFLFGTKEMLAAAQAGGAKCEASVTIPAAPHLGVVEEADGKWVVGTYEIGAIATAWPWLAEFVAACTREGKMPVMFQSIAVPTGMARMEKYKLKEFTTGEFVRWHDFKPLAVKEGDLARQWLTACRWLLARLNGREMKNIRLAAARAAQAKQEGHALWVIMNGHAPPHLAASPQDPHYFQDVTAQWERCHASLVGKPPVPPVEKPAIRTGDFVLGLGYHSVFNEDAYHQFADYVRSCGASAAWCAATYRPEEIKTAPGEIFIDAQWQFGDAEVTVPGYDIKVFPASGVVQCEVYLAIQAEMARILAEPKGK